MPTRIKYIRTAAMQKTPIGDNSIFTVDSQGSVPSAPKTWVTDGKLPVFTYWGLNSNSQLALNMEEMWTKEYAADSATISNVEYIRPENAYAGYRAILFNISKGKLKWPNPHSSYAFVVLGVCKSANAIVGYNPNAGSIRIVSRNSLSTAVVTSIPPIAYGTEFEIEVSESSFSVTVGGVKTTENLSSEYELRLVSLGYSAHGNASATQSFPDMVNLEAGDGAYEADAEKVLFSDAEWKNPAVDPRQFPSAFKDALLNCFRHVTWVEDSDGEEHINALISAMASESGGNGWESGVPYADIQTFEDERIYTTSNQGYVESAEGWARTDYVPCEGASSIVFSALSGGNVANANRCYFYSGGAITIQQFSLSVSQEKEITVPDGAVYFMISAESEALASCLQGGITPYA